VSRWFFKRQSLTSAFENAGAELSIKSAAELVHTGRLHMSEASERTLLLLKELALLKELPPENGQDASAERRKRRKEIREEIKRIAAEKRTRG
jgi:hypothetical protein